MAVPNTFAAATSAIPLANLDANFAYYDAAYSITGTATSFTGAVTLSTGTANGVPYLNASKVLTSGSVLTFDGTILSSTRFAGALNGTVGATTASTGAFTTLTTSSTVTLNGGTANGVPYLNGSKVLTSGTALTFDGTNLGVGTNGAQAHLDVSGSGIQYVRASSSTNTSFRGFEFGFSGNAQSFGSLAMELNSGEVRLSAGFTGWGGFQTYYVNGSEQMRLTSTGLGIGTSSPGSFDSTARQLVVGSGSAAQGITIYSSAATAGNIFFAKGTTGSDSYRGFIQYGQSGLGSASDAMLFGTAAAERMRLDSSGNLGLGVTPSPSTAPTMDFGAWAGVGAVAGSAAAVFTSNAYYDGAWKYKLGFGVAASRYQTNDGAHAWYNAPSGTAGTAITFTQAMTLDASGNLGVGATSGFNAISGTETTVYIKNSGANIASLYIEASRKWAVISGTSGQLGFYDITAGSERARIDSSGNLLVGKTAQAVDQVGAEITTTGIRSTIADSTNASLTYIVYSATAAAYRFYVGFGGTVYATNTTITSISDQRLKENIRDLDDGLDVVMALKPRKFDWKEGTGKNIKDDRGFIAQEFEQVLPDMIEEWKDPAPEGEEPYKAINANLIPTLVKAIQEQQALIESLTKRLTALESK